MASRYEVEVKLSAARDLKNVNWRYGPVKPYAVVWVDPKNKCSTRVDESSDTNPTWDETLVIPLPGRIEDEEYSTLYIDVVHAGSEPDTKRLIGSAKLRLREIVDDVGSGQRATRTLQLKRPSGRPHGKVEVKVSIRDPYYRAPDAYSAPPYGVPPPASRDYYAAPQEYGASYAAQPPSGYPYNAPSYGQSGYGQAPAYGQGSYGQAPPYGAAGYGQPEEKKKSKFGMGTGLAVGAAAGLLGGLAIAEGVDYVEDKIADDAAEKVEDDLGYDDDDF
ncbi:C2 domain containing protein [Trema orientale]|uniref:C2 domain containing protein n=1 Tax=Trema orientale TaxID=63057 RepID=A0A2P5B5U0_TREOI|nr:C2 domain containing protein [Trema orientale]